MEVRIMANRLAISIGIISVLSFTCDVTVAQDFPTKPIRMVVAGNPGGGGDFAMRIIAPLLSSSMGQQVIVDNRPSGPIPGETVAKAPPDGYTILVIGNSLWLGPLLGEHYPFDGIRDFSP